MPEGIGTLMLCMATDFRAYGTGNLAKYLIKTNINAAYHYYPCGALARRYESA